MSERQDNVIKFKKKRTGMIAGITAVDGSMSSEMMNIINEEAAAYFSGQKSAEEVAKIVQSRMQVYLSETN